MHRRAIEILVGLFMLGGLLALLVLALKVSGFEDLTGTDGYKVTAKFDNAGSLRVRSRVTIAGVQVGKVASVTLDPVTFQSIVTMNLNDNIKLPKDSSAAIQTTGLIGDNYVALDPGSDTVMLKSGDQIAETQGALILEKLIQQFLFNKNR
jgi:phospholipid/cholesterol/gamma-HCH transport system substrate-binding protein